MRLLSGMAEMAAMAVMIEIVMVVIEVIAVKAQVNPAHMASWAAIILGCCIHQVALGLGCWTPLTE